MIEHRLSPKIPRPLTRQVAQALRRLAISHPSGSFLGSEKELLARFGVSRPTFRQAVNLIEHEQLLSIVRGVKGGIFSRRPDIDAVISSASTYLMTREATLADMLSITTSLLVDAATLAALCTDDRLCGEAYDLTRALEARESVAQPLAAFEADEMRMIALLCEMSGNPAVDLVLRMLYSVGVAAFPSLFEAREDLMQYRRTARISLLNAVVARDAALAEKLVRQNGVVSRERIDPTLLGQRMMMLWDY